MLLPKFPRNLQNASTRRQAVDEAVAEARNLYRQQDTQAAREIILKLQDEYDSAGIDRLELLYAAESAFSGDSFWLSQIVDILLRKQSLGLKEMPYLLRQALLTPTRLDLWNRLFRERRAHGDPMLYLQDREQCALALLPFFPIDAPAQWPDQSREREAFNLLLRALQESFESIIDLGRVDAAARQVLLAGRDFFPDRSDVLIHLARILVREDVEDAPSVATVLEAVLVAPEELELKLWAAEALLKIPGQSANGLAMMRQLYEAAADNPTVRERYASALKTTEQVEDVDEPFLAEWVDAHPEDLRALELLADQYVQRSLLTEDALRIYRLAAGRSPKRRNYLRLMGKFYASQSAWSEVISIFDEIRTAGQETEDIIFPLAMAYSQFNHTEHDALQIYRRAIELGTRIPEVHDLYARSLYLTAPEAPESVAQFTETLALFPDCLWAQLGMLKHHVRTGDAGRALDGAVSLLQKNPMDREAIKLGAQALAMDFSRKQLAKLAALKQHTVGMLFEEAHRHAPDAGPIAMGLVRHRLSEGIHNLETARLLADVCRRNPEALDLRIARADLLWDLGQAENATALYRELLERWRAAGRGQLPRGVTPEIRRRILNRVAEFLLRPPGPTAADLDLLVEAAEEADASAEVVLGAARTLVDLQIDQPEKLQLLSRALRFAPGDFKLERARAEGFAAKGNPVPAVELATRLIENHEADDETATLIRSLVAVTKQGQIDATALDALREALSTCNPIPAVLLAGVELLLHSRPCTPEDRALLEKLAVLFPKNTRIKRWLAQSASLAGEEKRAMDLLEQLVQDSPENHEVLLELAKTHARLGQHEAGNLKIAVMAARLEPENVELQMHLAAIELGLGAHRSAATRLLQLLDQHPTAQPRLLALLEPYRENPPAEKQLLVLLGKLQARAGRIEQALQIISRLQEDYRRNYADLLTLYEVVIEAAPDHPRPRIERGILFRLSGFLDEAVADLHAAHQISPDNLDILSEYADLLAQKSDAQQSRDPDLCVTIAKIYLQLGSEENCFHYVEKALNSVPGHREALRLLARLQLDAGALKKCFDTLQKLPRDQQQLPLLQQLASAFAEVGDHLGAAEVLTQAIEVAGPQRDLIEQLRQLHQSQARALDETASRNRVVQSLSNRAQGRYELREEIGSGSMGLVYKAYDRELDEIVVLKILPEHFVTNPDALARFRNEAKAARKLAHPNIVRIHDFGEDGGRKHISMEYVPGGDLKTFLIKHGPVDPERAVQIIRDVARGLAHAHAEGVLHRDIKSANILLTASGRVKLSDFGIAALVEQAGRDAEATHGGTGTFGTPLYMSPEQFDGSPVTPASDLYSVGVLMYELLCGSPPFTRGSIAYHHQFTAPPPLHSVPPELWSILRKLLEKRPQDRYGRAEDLLEVLDALGGRAFRPNTPSIDEMQTPVVS